MKRRKIYSIAKEKLEGFSTKRLLGRLKSLHQCEQSFELSDKDDTERLPKDGQILFKNSSEWQSEYEVVKEILSKREHIS